MWLTTELASTVGGNTPPAVGTVDGKALEADVAAVEAYLKRRRPDIDFTVEGYEPPADLLLGAAMLANRYYQRRNSPLGTVGSPDMGLTSILRTDPDIADLLGIGPGRRFVFAAAHPAPPVVIP